MNLQLRPFKNTDLHTVCRLYNEHYRGVGVVSSMDSLAMELAVLAKPQFSAKNFLVAENDGEALGFAHFHIDTDNPGVPASIACLAVPEGDQADEIAAVLLAECEQRIRAQGVTVSLFRPDLPQQPFGLGFGPADSLIGTTSSETRLCSWLSAAGYEPIRPTSLWELPLLGFQPPVDRMQIQIRRSTLVNRQIDEPELPWWKACMLGHTEPVSFHLLDRKERIVLNEALFWTVAQELKAGPQDVAWLWPPEEVVDELTLARLTFLIAESARELQSESVDVIRTSTAADSVALNQCLQRLGFQAIQSGFVFKKLLMVEDDE